MAFFTQAYTYFAETSNEPFNFISATRLQNFVSFNLAKHLTKFLNRIKST